MPGIGQREVSGTVTVTGTVATSGGSAGDLTTAAPAVDITGQAVRVAGSVSSLATGTVSVVNTVTATGSVTVSGTITAVGVSGTVTVVAASGTVSTLDVGRTPVLLVVTSTSMGISGTMVLFTAYQGVTVSAAGVSTYVVPVGKTLRVLTAAMVVENSVTTALVIWKMAVVHSTAAPTWTTTSPLAACLLATPFSQTVPVSAVGVYLADVAAAATVGIGMTIGTSGGTLDNAYVHGYLFP